MASTLVLTGCQASAKHATSEGSAHPVSGPSSSAPDGSPAWVAVLTEDNDLHFLAGFHGTLGLTTERCFGISGPGESTMLVIFPVGTTTLADQNGVDVPGYGEIELGDSFRAGGAVLPTSDWIGFSIPPPCTDDQAAVLNFS